MTYIRWTFPVILFSRYNPYCNVPRRCFILVFLFDSSEVPSLHVPPRASYFHYSRLFSPLLFSLRLVTHHLSRVPRPRCRCRCCSIPSCSLVASPFYPRANTLSDVRLLSDLHAFCGHGEETAFV